VAGFQARRGVPSMEVLQVSHFDADNVLITIEQLYDPPIIEEQPEPMTVHQSNLARFQIAASGTEGASYRWQKDGTNLLDNERVSGADTDTLNIVPVFTTDAGLYRCRVNNPSYTVFSEAVPLILTALGDFDVDNDVDQEDFSHLQRCISGQGRMYDPGCEDDTLDLDNDVDQVDLLLFQNCFSGANHTPDC